MPHGLGSPHPRHARFRVAPGLAVAWMAALLSACAVNPAATPNPPPPAPAQPSLEALMQQAQSAARDGQRERARQGWRAAAKAYPTQKAPWQRLAEDYFDSADYGNAILAAQEVLQRDEQDTLAHSVVAVSGLRLSTVSLTALRERTNYPVGSREEAMGLTRAMREALGESALVPQRAADSTAALRAGTTGAASGVPRSAAAPASAPARAAASAPAVAAARTPQAARPAAAAPGNAPAVVPVAAPTSAVQAKPAGDPFKLLK